MLAQFSPSRRAVGVGGTAPAVNWRRGLLRLWLLASAAWVMGWAVYLAIYGIRGGFDGLEDLLVLPVLLLGPPIALLLFGAMTRWAFKGFVVEKDEPPP